MLNEKITYLGTDISATYCMGEASSGAAQTPDFDIDVITRIQINASERYFDFTNDAGLFFFLFVYMLVLKVRLFSGIRRIQYRCINI